MFVKHFCNDHYKRGNMTKGRPRKFDKDDALETAMKLFWQHGYEGVSIAKLAEAMGINVPSLYSAFGNKEKLFMAAFDKYSLLGGHIYIDSLKQKTAREVAYSILKGEVELVTNPEHPDGCMVILGALVTSSDSDHIKKRMDEMRQTPPKWMAERFAQAIKEGDLSPEVDPKSLACYIMTLNSGLAVQAKSGVGKKELMKVVDIAMRNWPFVD